ncbi:MAG: phosphate ABC transporter ATP-binding protein, partial [Candidatus Eisenbacteria sp.]|nr:phosphate ABC transporter ATP-binding protein [Candidatus Eisenbacteria bacterium]
RLCLARALALEPTILLLDEPTASLDFRATHGIEELLLRLRSKYTIVAVSHSLAQAQRLADSVLLIDQGRIARTFDREALYNKEAFFELVKDSL